MCMTTLEDKVKELLNDHEKEPSVITEKKIQIIRKVLKITNEKVATIVSDYITEFDKY